MTKRKTDKNGQTTIHKTLHRKLEIEQHESYQKPVQEREGGRGGLKTRVLLLYNITEIIMVLNIHNPQSNSSSFLIVYFSCFANCVLSIKPKQVNKSIVSVRVPHSLYINYNLQSLLQSSILEVVADGPLQCNLFRRSFSFFPSFICGRLWQSKHPFIN